MSQDPCNKQPCPKIHVPSPSGADTTCPSHPQDPCPVPRAPCPVPPVLSPVPRAPCPVLQGPGSTILPQVPGALPMPPPQPQELRCRPSLPLLPPGATPKLLGPVGAVQHPPLGHWVSPRSKEQQEERCQKVNLLPWRFCFVVPGLLLPIHETISQSTALATVPCSCSCS